MRASLLGVILFWAFQTVALADPPHPLKADSIVIAVRRDGVILWNGTPITCKQLNSRFLGILSKDERPKFKLGCGRPKAAQGWVKTPRRMNTPD
jgi:hypothetical protein